MLVLLLLGSIQKTISIEKNIFKNIKIRLLADTTLKRATIQTATQ